MIFKSFIKFLVILEIKEFYCKYLKVVSENLSNKGFSLVPLKGGQKTKTKHTHTHTHAHTHFLYTC